MLWLLAAGALIGFVFDWYRTFRRWRGWGKILTFSGDIAFSLLTLFVLVIFLQKANFLSFRFYSFAGVLVGLFLYLRIVSRMITGLMMELFHVLDIIFRLIMNALKMGFRGLGWLVFPFYAILRWFSLLFYRFSEVVFLGTAKTGREKAEDWWNRHFPPRTNG